VIKLLVEDLRPAISTAVENAISKQMEDKCLTIGEIKEKGWDVKFYAKDPSCLPKTKRMALWFHNHVGKEFFTWLSVALVFVSVFLVFANVKKDEIIDESSIQVQNAVDKTLQFDYLQSCGYATPETFLYLDSVFVTHRDTAAINHIKRQVDLYKAELKQAVDARIREDLQRKERMK